MQATRSGGFPFDLLWCMITTINIHTSDHILGNLV